MIILTPRLLTVRTGSAGEKGSSQGSSNTAWDTRKASNPSGGGLERREYYGCLTVEHQSKIVEAYFELTIVAPPKECPTNCTQSKLTLLFKKVQSIVLPSMVSRPPLFPFVTRYLSALWAWYISNLRSANWSILNSNCLASPYLTEFAVQSPAATAWKKRRGLALYPMVWHNTLESVYPFLETWESTQYQCHLCAP
jgi:hypothetical protein